MAYIRYAAAPDSIGVGRQARHVSYEEDTGASWVAEVDEVRAGEEEITAGDYFIAVETNRLHNATIPAPEPAAPTPPPGPTLAERVALLESRVAAVERTR